MFNVKENECVGFESRWKVTRVYSEGSAQTEECSQVEAATNSVTSAEIQTQTDEVPASTSSDVDMEKLSNWLSGIYPLVKRELNDATFSRIFRGYKLNNDHVDPHSKLLQTLNVSFTGESGDTALNVNAISWNATGNSLAISCNYIHKTWCHHNGQVNIYTFNINDKLPETPNRKIMTTACINVLRFHPVLPSVIVGGTYTGEAIIWNIQHDDNECVMIRVTAHEEPITEISWIHDPDDSKKILLATSSIDGFLNIWNFNFTSSSLLIKHKYEIKSPVLAKVGRSSKTPEEITKKIVRGIVSFDFSPYILDMFIVGVEGGLVIQCTTLGAYKLKGSTSEVPLSDPVFKYYAPHDGEISTVCFSPNRKEMFMTSATDDEIRIYLIGQDTPAQVIFTEKSVRHVSWVPYEEKLLVGCGTKGIIEIFNVQSGRLIPDTTTNRTEPSVLSIMEVNKKRLPILAVGNNKGQLQLWNIPWSLFRVIKLEN